MKVNIQTRDLTSVTDFVQTIETTSKANKITWALFRGQTSDQPLLPRIARDDNNFAKEGQLFGDFKRESLPYLQQSRPKNDWEFLTLAQQHGLPTRLLDWTRNPLAALWFAVQENASEVGVVWVYLPFSEHYTNSEDLQKHPFSINSDKIYAPNHITRRISSQASCFTIHCKANNQFIPFEENPICETALIKLTFDGNKSEEFRETLNSMGVNASTVFPDIDNLCKHLSWKYEIK